MTDLVWGIVLASALVVPALAYRVANSLDGDAVAIMSPILSFSIFWWLGYPLKAALLGWGLVTTQTGWAPQQDLLLQSESLSAALMLTILYGAARAYRSFAARSDDGMSWPGSAPWKRAMLVLAFCLLFSLYTLVQTLWIDFTFKPWKPYEQNWARYGKGWLFFWADAWIYVGIAALSGFLAYGHELSRRATGAMAMLVSILFAWSSVVGLAFASRRIIFAILLVTVAIIAVICYRKKRLRLSWALACIVCLAPVTAAGPLDAVRYLWMDVQEIAGPEQEHHPLWLALQSLASSFEGAEHLARYIQRGGTKAVLWGVDNGQSWLFNAGLALVPRQLWETKPVEAGAVAQQCWLWPENCPATRRDVAYLPPGFAVDFLFGFGVLGAAILALTTGWFLALVHRTMWYGTNPWSISVSMLAYVYLFNAVRGGTAFIQMLLTIGVLVTATWGLPRQFIRTYLKIVDSISALTHRYVHVARERRTMEADSSALSRGASSGTPPRSQTSAGSSHPGGGAVDSEHRRAMPHAPPVLSELQNGPSPVSTVGRTPGDVGDSQGPRESHAQRGSD